jgi:phospholipid-translocating ATPase
MAGDIGEGGRGTSTSDEAISPLTSPPQSAIAMDGPTAMTGPRVRFSVDIDRENAPPFSGQRPGTPNLSIDTRIGPREPAVEQSRSAASAHGQKKYTGISPKNAASPRTRDRGYSLRRTLFARGLNNESGQSPIELTEAGPSREGGAASGSNSVEQGKGKKSASSVVVSPVQDEYGGHSIEQALPTEAPGKTSMYKDKKPFGTRDLPNYDVWARRVKGEEGIVKNIKTKVQWFYSEKILKDVLRQYPIPPSKDGRHIDLDAGRKDALIDERTGAEYVPNTIRSSRYTLWNFIPRQLLFQFSKLANAYFLLVSVLQMVPGLSPTGSYTTIAPLLVFVTISMSKEGYDDFRRYKLDQIENNNETLVLHAYKPAGVKEIPNGSKGLSKKFKKGRGIDSPETVEDADIEVTAAGLKHWATLKWKDIKVGDIIKLRRDDAVPADIVLLHADGPNNTAFIETMALDGETNLKTKQPPVPLAKKCSTTENLVDCHAHIVVEDPNLDLYNFDGRVTVDGETLPLTTNEVVFRGSILRNTSSAIGMVINTGEECKIRMNANKNPRAKSPEMQKIVNKIVIILVVFVVLLALFCTIAYQVWSDNVESHSWYLVAGSHFKFSYSIVGFIILFNTLIPLSLYVSLEIIKVGQLLLMHDVEMYDPVSNTPMTSNTSTILENLGQIGYVFSDKTGTLTDNVMRFRKLSVAGYAWLHDFDLVKEAADQIEQHPAKDKNKLKNKGKGVVRRFSSKKKPSAAQPGDGARSALTSPTTETPPRRSGSLWRSSAQPNRIQPELRTEEMIRYMQSKPHSIFTKKAKFFLLSIALCHTCLPEVKESGDIEFQAASPDELALVRAAQELGYLVIDRPARSITLKVLTEGGDVTEIYEVLDVIEFSSKRKRMSIIVRFPNGKICILCKGADSSILPRLKLAPLAMQKVSEVQRRSSIRKSLEAEEYMRRMSDSSPRASFSRPSVTLSRPSMSRNRRSINAGRPSMTSTRLQPIRDELDSWLRDRESDVEVSSLDGAAAYRSPRASMGGFSFANSEMRPSMQAERFDEFVDDALVLDDAAVFERCFQHIDDFAGEGLRTLLFGYRFLGEQEYTGWKKIYLDATTSLVDRQQLIENAGEMIEQDFDLAGATAIEDKLQKGVPETVDKLRRANIKIWMLTGDKRETAINIAHSARICKNYSEVVILDRTTGEVEQRMATTLLDIGNGSIAHSVIVVDGQTLADIDANQTLSLLFFDLVVQADSVICCRASPSQKASLVKKIRTKVNKSITLAIGDGANDIAMIQEAHVGIGISGKEGLQAARISDYSIAQFRFLQRLLFVHGHWNYVRTGKYILGTFWKEFLFFMNQAMYQKWNGYSGTSLFESASLTVFNTLFTSLCVILLGIFDQDLEATTLLAVPELYSYGQRDQGFNIKKYFGWTFMAASEMVMIYFLTFGLFGEALFTEDNTLYSLGTLCFTAAVIIIVTKLM